MDSNNTTTQYSPLNNLSSGEEVEQFSLPVSANLNKPKRRRKRKEFDSLKAQNIVTHKSGGVCRLNTCIVTFTFILLVAGVCGLSVLVYQLYVRVHELQKEFSALKNVDKSHTTSMGSFMSRLENEQRDMITVKANINTINQTLEALRKNLNDVDSELARLNEKQAEKAQVTDLEDVKTLEGRLAQFGSDVTSMQTDVATLQQQQLSNEARFGDLDAKITSAIGMVAEPGDQAERKDQVKHLLQKIQAVNNTLLSRLDSTNGLLQRAYTNYTALDKRLSDIDSAVSGHLEQLDQDLWMVNVTVERALSTLGQIGEMSSMVGQPANMVPGDDLSKLTGRVDSLETSLREIYLRQQDKMATLTENQVVNLTVSRGMEDIISRVINQELEPLYDRMDNVSHHSASLDVELAQLDGRFNSLSQQIGNKVKLTERVDALESALREVYLRQQDELTTLTENQVVNLTIAGGMEDIVTRVINQKLAPVFERMDNVSYESESLGIEFNSLSRQISNLVTLNQTDTTDNDTGNFTSTSIIADKPAEAEITESSVADRVNIDDNTTQSSATISPNSNIAAESTSSNDGMDDTAIPATPSLQELLNSPR